MAGPPTGTPTSSLGSGVRGARAATKSIVTRITKQTPTSSKGPVANGSPTRPAPGTTNQPSALAPLTAKQIVNQAHNTITKAYAPQYQDLSQQTKLAEGLASKRAADDQYYQTWLDTQGHALQAHADAADATLQGQENAIASQQSQLYSQQPGQLVQGADSRAGNVSNNANSLAFGADLNANQQQNMGLLQNTQNLANQTVDNSKGQVGAALAMGAGEIQNVREKALTDLDTALTTIATTRSKLNTAQTGDIAKEIARLQGIEIQKAQSNRDFQATVDKLGLTAAETKSLIQSRDLAGAQAGKRLALQQQGLDQALTKAQYQQMNSDRQYQLDLKKYNATTAKDIYERQHNLGAYKPPTSGTTATTKPLSTTSQNVIYTRVDKAGAEMNQLIGYGLTPQDAYHKVLNGGLVTVTDKSGKTHPITVPAVGDSQIMNAAYNGVVPGNGINGNPGGGLSPGDIAALKHLGLTNPSSRYKLSTATTNALNGVLGLTGVTGHVKA